MPFEEKEHTADIAFIIRGENFNELYHNAQIALCFYHNKIFPYLQLNQKEKTNIDEVIISLNEIITIIDREIGSPFKAVSFHSNITTSKQNLLQWEMIVDV
jgi:SHS2 domain-containing protein